MKVINNATQTVRFCNLPIGHVFYDHNGDWYLKCETFTCEDYAGPVNAANLETGEFENFMPADNVYPVNGKFVAESFSVST